MMPRSQPLARDAVWRVTLPSLPGSGTASRGDNRDTQEPDERTPCQTG
jgi:hypothetical protein